MRFENINSQLGERLNIRCFFLLLNPRYDLFVKIYDLIILQNKYCLNQIVSLNIDFNNLWNNFRQNKENTYQIYPNEQQVQKDVFYVHNATACDITRQYISLDITCIFIYTYIIVLSTLCYVINKK